MNKFYVIMIVLLFLSGCTKEVITEPNAIEQTPNDAIQTTTKKDVIEMPADKFLSDKIAKAINKDASDITNADLLQMEEFSFTFDDFPAEERSKPNKQAIDLSIIGKMKNLKKLTITHIYSQDFKFLTNLSHLENLSIVDFGTEQLPDLKTISNLKSLVLSNGDLTNIEFVKSFPKLQQLDISLNPIQDIMQLQILSSLVKLDIHGTQIKSAKSLTQLHSLRNLSIDNNVKDLNLLVAQKDLTVNLVVPPKSN
jgi:hypothetical protein